MPPLDPERRRRPATRRRDPYGRPAPAGSPPPVHRRTARGSTVRTLHRRTAHPPRRYAPPPRGQRLGQRRSRRSLPGGRGTPPHLAPTTQGSAGPRRYGRTGRIGSPHTPSVASARPAAVRPTRYRLAPGGGGRVTTANPPSANRTTATSPSRSVRHTRRPSAARWASRAGSG